MNILNEIKRIIIPTIILFALILGTVILMKVHPKTRNLAKTTEREGGDVYVSMLGFSSLLNAKPDIYYVSSGDPATDAEMLNEVLYVANNLEEGEGKCSIEDCKKISSKKFYDNLKFLRTFFLSGEIVFRNGIEDGINNASDEQTMWYHFYTYDDIVNGGSR